MTPALCAGDFNRDGFDDVAAGVPGRTITGKIRAGTIAVSPGTGTVPNVLGAGKLWHQDVEGTKTVVTIDSGIRDAAEAGDDFGSALFCGDFNGDGFDDVAIGVPGEDNASGAVNVIYGSASGLRLAGNQIFRESSFGSPQATATALRFGAVLLGNNPDVVSVAGLDGFWTTPIQSCSERSCVYSVDEALGVEDGTAFRSLSVPLLTPGAQVKFRLTLKAPRRKRTNRILAVLDSAGQVVEVDETNNTVVSPKPRRRGSR